MKITVYFEANAVKPTVVQNATVVLVDVLRATTTIPMFLYHGASGVVFCHDPGTAKKHFEKLKRGEGLLAGEREWERSPVSHERVPARFKPRQGEGSHDLPFDPKPIEDSPRGKICHPGFFRKLGGCL